MIPISSFCAVLSYIIRSIISFSVHAVAGFRFCQPVPLLVIILCVFTCGCGGSDGTANPKIDFWVSPDGNDESPGTSSEPFLTLERARDAVRDLDDIKRGSDISIYIRSGTYRLGRPFVLDWRDSGRNGHDVVYRAAPGEQPVISGSVRVQNWSLHDPALGIYQAYVGQRESRQLYVNGQRAVRARTSFYPASFRPAFFYLYPDGTSKDGISQPVGIQFIPSDLNPEKWRDPFRWTNKQDIEAVIVTQWKMMSVPLQSVTPYPQYTPYPNFLPYPPLDVPSKTGLIVLQEPGWQNANISMLDSTKQPGIWSFWQVTLFENAYEFLDEPGEWYLNRSTGILYYIPRPGEDLEYAEVELPIREILVEGRGDLGQPVSNIRFEGLTFSYATWLSPSTSNGYVTDQSGFHLIGNSHQPNVIGHDPDVVRTPGNIKFKYAHNIGFHGNTFAHLGGVGLDLDTGSQGNTIVNNLFMDISSAAIQLGGVSTIDHHPVHPEQITKDNVISNNLIWQVCQQYVDAAGIYVGFTRSTLISHNTIIDVPWSGIAVGWGWGLLDPGMFPGVPGASRGQWGSFTTPTPNSDNKILNNLIAGFLNVVWDGGAIYTTGQQGTSMSDALLIEGNVAYGKRLGAGGNTFYTDGGSRYIVLKDNVSHDNYIGVSDFGPPANKDDKLPYPSYSDYNGFSYGADTGGCRTYGDISFVGNYLLNFSFYDICPFLEDGVSYPTNLYFTNNHLIQWEGDVPQSILDAAGVQNFPQAILDTAGIRISDLLSVRLTERN